MKLAKSTYYFELNKVDAVEIRNLNLIKEIQVIFEKHKKRYSVRCVHKELVNRGINVNYKRIQRSCIKWN